MSIVQPPVVKSIMAIAAHPDDIESWCAGTLVLAHARGAKVRLLLVTSGEHGTSDSHVPAQQVALQREREARSAAEILGISEIAFLHYPDGDVEDTHTLRGQLLRTGWHERFTVIGQQVGLSLAEAFVILKLE